jgi:hypothetical protein
MLNIYSGRKRFNTLESVSDILWNMIVGCCPASCRFSRDKGSHQRRRFAIANLYKNASERFTEELDIIKLLKSIRVSKKLFREFYTPEDKLLFSL